VPAAAWNGARADKVRIVIFSPHTRIVFLVLAMSSFAAGDDTPVLRRMIDGCRVHGRVALEPRTYSVTPLALKSDCTYTGIPGKTVLKLNTPNQFIFDISERKDIRISGIGFDGSGIGGAIAARGNGPAFGINVENCSFTGVSSRAVFPANLAIFSSWALIDSAFRKNVFNEVAGGLWITTVQNLSIADNTFNRVTQGNAIYIAPNPVPFPSGRNLRITGNRGSGLARMGIEIFRPDPTNGSTLESPLIENNSFTEWTSPRDGMGLSITHGDGAIIRNNIVRNSGRAQQYLGIEVIVRNALIEGNRIDGGFAYGIAVQGTAAPRIIDNRIEAVSDTGIILACDNGRHRCASHDAVISGNSIVNARKNGIFLDNDWARSRVEGNTISRTGGFWPDDNAIVFAGITHSAATGPGTIESNTIVQAAPAPPKGFGFCGIRVNAPVPGSVFSRNVVRSESNAPVGTGVIDNTGSATARWTIENNRFVNLARDKS
jgi:parallel beta-helix repeat protein